MRLPVFMIAGLLATQAIPSAAAPAAHWCGHDMTGETKCYFETEAQCRATMHGEGGTCVPAPGATLPKQQKPASSKPAPDKPR